MPFDIADLFAKRRLVNVDYEGATLEIHYEPSRFDVPTVMKLQELFRSARNESEITDVQKGADIAASLIVDWNASYSGAPIEISSEELSQWDAGFVMDILLAINEDYNASKNGKGSSSTSKATVKSGRRRNGTAT